MARIKPDAFEALGRMLKPPPPPTKATDETWTPDLNPSNQRLFDSTSKYILCWSEKGSGKSHGCIQKMVRHCYENQNALGLIVVSVKSMATKGGAWDELINEVLPQWKAGLGLDFSDVKHDEQHNQFVWVANQYGGWSMIVVISSPHADQLRTRIRGYAPSCVFVDELTSCESVVYFEAIAAQLGRRKHVTGPQQYLAACNPEGPSHWVYQTWFVEAFDEETGEWDPDFENIYYPFADNEKNITAGYQDSLKKIYRHNPLEAARMIRGEWVDRPAGEALFRDLYNPAVHVYPLNDEMVPDFRNRLRPITGHPIIIGLDPGAVYNSYVFQQWLNVEGKMKWVAFDEMVVTKKRVSYEKLIPLIMGRVVWWRKLVLGDAETLPQIWLSDNSAFNQWRASTGSFDVLDIEKIYEAHRARLGLEAMKIKPAPKFNGSKVARVRLVQDLLAQDKVVISSCCPQVQKMFLQLQGPKQKPGVMLDAEAAMTPERSDVLHVWDAFSYPILTASLNPTSLTPNSGLMGLVTKAA